MKRLIQFLSAGAVFWGAVLVLFALAYPALAQTTEYRIISPSGDPEGPYRVEPVDALPVFHFNHLEDAAAKVRELNQLSPIIQFRLGEDPATALDLPLCQDADNVITGCANTGITVQ